MLVVHGRVLQEVVGNTPSVVKFISLRFICLGLKLVVASFILHSTVCCVCALAFAERGRYDRAVLCCVMLSLSSGGGLIMMIAHFSVGFNGKSLRSVVVSISLCPHVCVVLAMSTGVVRVPCVTTSLFIAGFRGRVGENVIDGVQASHAR